MKLKTSADPLARTFTALPTAWLWPAGPPIWQMSALGAVVALSAVAVPALPTVLPDKPPSHHNPAVAAPVDHDDSNGQKKNVPTSVPSTTGPAGVPTVTAVVPSSQAGETPSEKPTATGTPSSTPTAAKPSATETPAPPQSSSPPADPGGPAVPPVQPVTIAATDPGNQRWLVTGTDCDSCVSGSRIVGLGLLATLTVPIDADSAGSRQLTIAYETRLQRDLYVTVNGGKAQKLKLPGTGGFEKPGWTSVEVELRAGTNNVIFSNPLGLAPDLDQITVG